MPPFVSIILPVRNEEKFISACLQSIITQDFPAGSMEVLIVDGLSDDSTLAIINEFKIKNTEIKIDILENPGKVVSAGLNIGFKAAKGDVIIRMDAHAGYGKDYIRQCLNVLEKTGSANVGGPALALPGGNTSMAHAIALAHLSPFGLGGGAFRNPGAEGFVETVWPGCFRREVFDKAGYIDERRTRTEDIEFNSRLLKAGYKIYLSPVIKAYYYCRTTLAETWRQRWADGYEITHFLPDNPQAPRLRHFIPLIFVCSLILLAAIAIFHQPETSAGAKLVAGFKSVAGLKTSAWSGLFEFRRWNLKLFAMRLLLLELLAYFGAMLFFTLRSCNVRHTTFSENPEYGIPDAECRPGIFALLPAVFLTLHFSYGLGSIWGLVSLPWWRLSAKNRPRF